MQSMTLFWKTVWRFIKPETEELIAYVLTVLGFVLLGFLRFNSSGSSNTQDVTMALSVITDRFAFLTDGDDNIAKLFTFGLWFVIGTGVYMLAWFLVTFSGGAFHDMEVSKDYVHPTSFKKSDFWTAVLGRAVLRTAAAVSLMIYIAFWIAAIAPVWLASVTSVFIQGISVEVALDALIALVGIALSVHIAAILLRFVLLRSTYS